MYFSKILLFILILALLFCCSCAKPATVAESSSTPTIAPTIAPKPTPPPTPTPTATPTPTSVNMSLTSGIPLDTVSEYKPIGVIIENSPAARPQSGLQVADIVYEAPVEGCTRFFCIFNDTLPIIAGPVRSARLYYIRAQQEWDCAFAHFGGPQSGKSNVYTPASNHIKTRIDFIKGAFNDYYWRNNDISAPHNAYTDVSKLPELVEEPSIPRPFDYSDEPVYIGKTVSTVVLPFYTGEVTYRYDAQKDVLLRYYGDKEFIDRETESIVEVKNLLVQYINFYHGGEAKGRWLCDQLGSGKAEYIINGKHIIGTWERETFEEPTTYKDSDGSTIVLSPGNTWITLHPDDVDITVTYE